MAMNADNSERSLYLSLRPGSGLGNRIRALLSAAAVAEAEERAFYYHWPITGSFGARASELWSSVPGIEIDAPGPEPIITDVQVDGKWQPASIAELRDDPVISVNTAYVLRGWGGERDWTDVLADLSVSPAVYEVIHRGFPGGRHEGSTVVGVQVRAHPTLTHPLTMQRSPVSWFIDRMHEVRKADDSVSFFLSADTREAEAEIASAVPDVSFIAKHGKYNSREGLIESVADLQLLSQTSRILAPYWSSFADIAWQMSGRAMPIETSQAVKQARA